ncbi:MAG: thioredoxin domain-containing protein [Carnobacterium maltaromaticum]
MKRMMVFIGLFLMMLPVIYLSINKESDVRDNIALAAEINKKSDDIVYVLAGSQSCGACREFVPIITKAIKEVETEVYYLDATEPENKEFIQENKVYATPTLLKLDKNKKIISRYEGVLSLEETKNILQGKE